MSLERSRRRGRYRGATAALAVLLWLSGCLGEDPASFRGADQLLPGHWVEILDFSGIPDPMTIDFGADGTVQAPSGLPGLNVPRFVGAFWQRGNVLGVRGSGDAEGIHVVFLRIELRTDPELILLLTEILPEHVVQVTGIRDLNSYSIDHVRDGIRLLFGSELPPSVLGATEDFTKEG